ncbi:MAG: universal stress protein [Haloferacaceae archaeon]
MYDEILVPTDGSDAARHALRQAIDLATQYDARLHALYVKDTSAYTSLEGAGGSVLAAMETEGERAVSEVEDAATDAGVDVVTAVVEGAPHRAIVDYVEDNDVDLVVMGTHGRHGIERYVLGSVTERVVRSSPAPVLTVRQTDSNA